MSGQASGQAAIIRNVLGFAREVRIQLHDSRVIFASVVDGADHRESFVVRPWGVPSNRTYLYDDVTRVAPVKRMDWHKQRAISASQASELTREVA